VRTDVPTSPRPPNPFADPVVRLAAALLLGLVAGVDLPGADHAWLLLAVGAAGLALPLGGLTGLRGALAAALVGACIGRAVPQGPTFDGDLGLIGIRVGAGVGRTGDVEIGAIRAAAGPWGPGAGRVRVRFPDRAPPAGSAVVALGRAGRVQPVLPGAPDPVRAARLAGVRTEVVARRAEVLGGDARAPVPPEADPTGLLRALALGDRSGVSDETRQVLRRTGTSHLLAISGFHVGAAAGMVALGGVWALRSAAIARSRGVSHLPAVLLAVIGAWAYTAVTGWSVPAQRAAALLTAAAVARSVGRNVAPLPVLAVVAVALAILDPGAPATASYQLSFGAVTGLVTLSPRLMSWLPPAAPRLVRSVAGGVAATLAATLGTLPFAAWWFQEVAPLSPLANLGAVPLVGFGVAPMAGLAAVAPQPIAGWAAWAGTGLCRALLWGLSWLAVAPWTPAVGRAGAVGLGAALVLAPSRPCWALGLGAAVLLAPRLPPSDVRITFLDVGQGDATLVEWADGRRWLVDGGGRWSGVADWLRRVGVRRLDAVIVTHPDADHAAGLVPVVEGLRVGAIWAVDPPPDLVAAAAQRGVPIGRPLGALHPWPEDPVESDNDGSIVLRVGPAILMGDAERAAEGRVASRVAPAPVLRIGHHGSATSSGDVLLDAVRPALAVVSVGRNAYGHPAPEVLARLRARGIAVLRTDERGTIEVSSGPPGVLQVRTAR
jgi:competence protein ComEC